jgi:putative spermidine/putrescine transport system ATP-binding protein
MSVLALEKIEKRFGSLIALQGIDLTVTSGEFVSLLGPSGCGKTTALRIISGFERPDDGRVFVDGAEITRKPPTARDIGMVFQANSLFPNMTALENVTFGLRVRKMRRHNRQKRATELLDLVGLADASGRYPHQLSGGEQQRVALVRALAVEPRVLLLDEPLSALDAAVRLFLREEIRRIQTELGITTIYVTHDQEEALSISDRVVVLSQGRIQQVGTPAEIYGAPQTLFVAKFVGTMNCLEGSIAAEDGFVKCAGTLLPVGSDGHWPAGTPVALLLRPESIDLAQLSNGARPPQQAVSGTIESHTFLGPVTRLDVASPVGKLKVDVPSIQALSLAIGAHVSMSWHSSASRLVKLPDQSQNDAQSSA